MFFSVSCSSSSFYSFPFGFNDKPSESNSIGIALPLRVPPIAHDDDSSLCLYHFILAQRSFDDVM